MSTPPDDLTSPHDLSSPGRIAVDTGTMPGNVQTGGVSVSNNNTYHPGSHHSNPVFYGNPDGSPTIVYYNHGLMSDPGRLQGHFGPAMHVRHEQHQRSAPPPYQPQPRGRGARPYRVGPPPPPSPPRPPPRSAPLHSGAGGGYATSQQRSSHGQHHQQINVEQNEESTEDSRDQDPQYQDPQYYGPQYPQYQDLQYQDPQYGDSRYAQHPHPQADPPSPNTHTEYPPPPPSMRGSPTLPSPPHAQAQSFAASSRVSYSWMDSPSSNGFCDADNMLSQSSGLPPEQHIGRRASPHPYALEGEGENRSENGVVQGEVSLPRPPTFAPVPAPASLAAAERRPTPSPAPDPASMPPVQASVTESSPPPVINEPQHQECDGIFGNTARANAGTPSSSHSHLAESSTKSSEKGKEKEKSKRSSWMSGFFKGSSKNSNMESGVEGASGDDENDSESKSKSKRGSILGFGKN